MTPIPGVPQGDFLETDPFAVMGAADVHMAVDYHGHRETGVPILGSPGAAPEGEAGKTPQMCHVLAQGEMVDQDHGGSFPGGFFQSFFRFQAALGTPGRG